MMFIARSWSAAGSARPLGAPSELGADGLVDLALEQARRVAFEVALVQGVASVAVWLAADGAGGYAPPLICGLGRVGGVGVAGGQGDGSHSRRGYLDFVPQLDVVTAEAVVFDVVG